MAKEMQSRKWFWFAIVFQNVFAYAVTLVIYQIGSFLLYGTFSAWTVIAFAVLLFMLFMLFRPDPYKNQKKAFLCAGRWPVCQYGSGKNTA